jgi:predicted MFS family arabinose efflux permease
VTNPWLVLAVLILARTSFGMQYQSVGAVGPAMMAGLGLDYTDLGTLIGAYSTLGLLVALLAGWLIVRFGDRTILLSGLSLMIAGGALMAVAPGFTLALTGRVLSGTGSVLLVVAAPKMTMDLFAGPRLPAAMGALMSAYPLGITLALIGMPLLGDWRLAMGVGAGLCVLALLAATTTPATVHPEGGSPKMVRLDRKALVATVTAGLVWAFLNAAYGVVLGFAPAWFVQQGTSPHTAGLLTSIAAFTTVPLGPLGGWALGRSGKPVRGIGLCLIAMTLAYLALPGGIASAVCLLVVGAMVGLCAGPIMALPGEVLAPQHRALGMGLFYAIYYGGMTVLPPLAGRAGDATGSAAAPLVAAALFSLLSVLSLLAYAGARRRD